MARSCVAIALAAAAAPALAAEPPLTSDGWGALRIGMSEDEVVRRFGVELAADDDVNSIACRESRMPGPAKLVVMTEDGRVTRLTLYEASPVRTDRGMTIGSTAAEVRRAYGASLKAERHAYEDPPAEYLTFRTGGAGRGLRYEIGADGRVAAIHAGLSIDYVEGCL